MEIIEPTQEEIMAQGYNPSADPEIKKDTIILDPGVTPRGDNWTFYMSTPIKGKMVYKNYYIEQQNSKHIYFQTTTKYYRGLHKVALAIDPNLQGPTGRPLFDSYIINFCHTLMVSGTPLSLARYIQENCYKSFVKFLNKAIL